MHDFMDLLALAALGPAADPVVRTVLRDFALEVLAPEPPHAEGRVRTIDDHGNRPPRRGGPLRYA